MVAALGNEMTGKSIVQAGSETIDGMVCDVFKVGVNTEAAFFTENHLAVSPEGTVYILDFLTGEWGLFENYGPYWTK